ncbi:MAG: threonylcarbamoyl-AMP synthase [Mailhella sp.]|nr:threonylcarbamoyl-AMP synthase [Mailhella sp.]
MAQVTLSDAASILKNDGLVIYPTETFFGIGCRVSSENAIAGVFRVKKRLLAMPLPVIISDASQLEMITSIADPVAADVAALAERFWPGPLSIMLRAKRSVSPLLTGGTGKIVVRISSHPAARSLCAAVGEPIVSSSANISGRPARTDWTQIDKELLDSVGAVFNEGPAPSGGLPSTIIEPSGSAYLHIHRLGAVGAADLVKAGFHIGD